MLRRINVKVFGLALGIVWAAVIFLLGFAASFDYGIELVNSISKLFISYDNTFFGSLIGAVWAFAYGFLVGAGFAWVYNIIVDKV